MFISYSILTAFGFSLVQTGVALHVEVTDKMPDHEYLGYYGPDYNIHVATSNMENKNSRKSLDDIKAKILDNLSKLQHAPSVQFQEWPTDTELDEVLALFCLPLLSTCNLIWLENTKIFISIMLSDAEFFDNVVAFFLGLLYSNISFLLVLDIR